MCVIVNENNFQEEVLKSRTPVLVEIRAQWSGACQIMAPIIEDLALRAQGRFKIARIDIETDSALAAEFGVIELPHYLFFKEGKLRDHIIGAVSKKEMEKWSNQLLFS